MVNEFDFVKISCYAVLFSLCVLLITQGTRDSSGLAYGCSVLVHAAYDAAQHAPILLLAGMRAERLVNPTNVIEQFDLLILFAAGVAWVASRARSRRKTALFFLYLYLAVWVLIQVDFGSALQLQALFVASLVLCFLSWTGNSNLLPHEEDIVIMSSTDFLVRERGDSAGYFSQLKAQAKNFIDLSGGGTKQVRKKEEEQQQTGGSPPRAITDVVVRKEVEVVSDDGSNDVQVVELPGDAVSRRTAKAYASGAVLDLS